MTKLSPLQAYFLYTINEKFTIQDARYIPYKILYDTKNAISRGARYHVYPVALGRGKEEKKMQNYIEQYSKENSLKRGPWWLIDRWQKFE